MLNDDLFDFEQWQNGEYHDPTAEEIREAEEWLKSMDFKPMRVTPPPNTPNRGRWRFVDRDSLPERYHGRWDLLSLTDFQMLYQMGISID